jgi:hypothetical protein
MNSHTNIGCFNILHNIRQEYLPNIEAMEKINFPYLQRTVTNQPKKHMKNKFPYLQVTDMDVNRVLSLTTYRNKGKINFHTYKWQTWMSKHLTQHPITQLGLSQAHIEVSLPLNIRTYE